MNIDIHSARAVNTRIQDWRKKGKKRERERERERERNRREMETLNTRGSQLSIVTRSLQNTYKWYKLR